MLCWLGFHYRASASVLPRITFRRRTPQEPRIRCARDLRLTVSDRAREQILPTACDAARHGHAAKANDRNAGAARAQLYCLHVLRNPPVNRSPRLQPLTLQRNRELRQGAAAIQGAPGCPPQFRRAPRLLKVSLTIYFLLTNPKHDSDDYRSRPRTVEV